MNASSKETTKPVSRLHDCICQSQDCSFVLSLVQENGSNILWASNSVGWTAVHFFLRRGKPQLKWWQWILGRALEHSDADVPEESCQADNDVTPVSSIRGQTNKFVSARTSLGYSCVDVFFLRFLHPLKTWRPEQLHEDAKALKVAIENVLSSTTLLENLRNGIAQMQRNERERQARSGGDCDSIWLEPEISPKMAECNQSVLKVLDFWHRMELLLMAAYLGTLDFHKLQFDSDNKSDTTSRKWRVVHALAFTSCPMEVAKLALTLYPSQSMEYDEDGNLPLHIAAAASPSLVVEQDNIAQHGDSRPYIIEALVQTYPNAAPCLNRQEQLPLNIALTNGKAWESGVRHLLQASPTALRCRDVPSHLHPFMLAALPRDARLEETTAELHFGVMWSFLGPISREKHQQEAASWLDTLQTNTIFEILKATPDLVTYGIPFQ